MFGSSLKFAAIIFLIIVNISAQEISDETHQLVAVRAAAIPGSNDVFIVWMQSLGASSEIWAGVFTAK